MFNYGKENAKEHKIKAKEHLQLEGWSTWDYYGSVYNNRDIIKILTSWEQTG
jgi:hypothetical protein